MRDQDDRSATGSERRMDVAETLKIVVHVLQHVKTDYRVHALSEGRKIVRPGEVAVADLQVGSMMKAGSQTSQMLFIDIPGNIQLLATDKLSGEIPDPG